VVADLPAPELMEEVRQAYAEDLVDTRFIEFESFEPDVQERVPADSALDRRQLITDAIGELEGWTAFQPTTSCLIRNWILTIRTSGRYSPSWIQIMSLQNLLCAARKSATTSRAHVGAVRNRRNAVENDGVRAGLRHRVLLCFAKEMWCWSLLEIKTRSRVS
jgi:hypothetical protein